MDHEKRAAEGNKGWYVGHVLHAAATIALYLTGGDVGLVAAVRASRTLEETLAAFKGVIEGGR